MTSIAILTADQPSGQRLQARLQASLRVFSAFDTYLVRDEPDPAVRALSDADIVIFHRSVSSLRVSMILRAISLISDRSRSLLIMPRGGTCEELLEYLRLGVRAILPEDSDDDELVEAIPQITAGQVYLSPRLVPVVLEHYRELCARMRRSKGGDRNPIGMRLYL